MKKPTFDGLPDNPSDLIRVALRDLEEVEKRKTHEVVMGTWHSRKGGGTGVCQVCLAGAVMARLVGYRVTSLVPKELPEYEKLNALDDFRNGAIGDALCMMGICPEDHGYDSDESQEIESYHDDPAKFKKEMEILATELEAKGL